MALDKTMWVGYPIRFTWGTKCPDYTDWCMNPHKHPHGLQCDKTCPCRVENRIWDTRARTA